MIRPLLVLLLVVIGCAAAARFLASGETLAEYAAENPATAYGTEAAIDAAGDIPAATDSPDTADTASSSSASTLATSLSAKPVADEDDANATPSSAATIDDAALVDDSDVIGDRVTYAEGFFYEPIPATVYRRMVGNSYPEDCPIALDELRYLNIRYINFDDAEQVGEIVCNAQIAGDLVEIFYDLHEARYQLESVRLIDDYGGDDDASMLDNNTSCFNYRTVAGSSTLSNHARGLAIDINPFYNPWVNHGKVSPPEAEEYADRTKDFAHKIDRDDLCCQCFLNHGFFWGGNWNNPDYQHFQRN